MVGCTIIGFCWKTLKPWIKQIHSTKIWSGLGGKAGNKGCVSIRFNIDETSIILLCCHLPSGTKKDKERV